MKNDLFYLPLTEMASAIRHGELSPVELLEAHIARVEALQPRLHAFAHTDFEHARRRAKEAEAELLRSNPSDLPALFGVPITIKSSIDVAGLPCECGSRLRRDYVAQQDAPLVARLRGAGAIILGNTNVPEFLMAYETDNLLYGRTNNPWDLERTPGGSSGGEAAAIASGCSAGGIGSDGGGSIRIPAHYSGICGLKPTPGRVPTSGHFPGSAGPFSYLGVVGPMARGVNDVRTIFNAIAGPDPGDPCAAPVPLREWNEDDIRGLRVAYFEDDGITPVTPETAAAIRAAADCLRRDGFHVEPWTPENLGRVWRIWWNLFGRAGQMAFSPMQRGRESEFSPVYQDFRGRVAAEPPLSAQELLDTLLERDVLRARFLAKMETYPILLCPVCAIPAFRHGEREWFIPASDAPKSGRGQRVEYLKAMSYSQYFNVFGSPAVSVPVGRSPEGLPIGVQVVARPWHDEAALALSEIIERGAGPLPPPPVGSDF